MKFMHCDDFHAVPVRTSSYLQTPFIPSFNWSGSEETRNLKSIDDVFEFMKKDASISDY